MTDFFKKTMQKVCERNQIEIDFNSFDDEFEVYSAILDAGVEHTEIVNTFSNAISLPFYNVMKKEFKISAIIPDKIEMLAKEIKIYPFIEDNTLMVAVSNREQMQAAENLISEKDYMFCFSFQFIIDAALDSVDIDYILQSRTNKDEKGLSTVDENLFTLLLASGQDDVDYLLESSNIFMSRYITIGKIDNRKQIIPFCESEKPDIILVGDNIGGTTSLTEILLKVKTSFPDIRIIYLAGDIEANDTYRKIALGTLAAAGINDIVTQNDISISSLKSIFDNPMSYLDNKMLIDQIKDSGKKKKNNINIIVPESVQNDDSVTIYENLFTFTSGTGSSGKSLILQNVAIAIATSGAKKTNGQKPKVAIIDLDFESFTTSRFFGTLDSKDNIFKAIESASEAIDSIGTLKEIDAKKENEINETIKMMFKQTQKHSNIFVLGGTDKIYHSGDSKKLNNYLITYIVESIIDEFDIVLIDGSTDMDAMIIYPMLSLSNTTYYIVDMNWNAMQKNKRFLVHLEDRDFFVKEQSKYILNKAIKEEDLFISIKDIESGLGGSFTNIIPYFNHELMFNMLSKGENFIQSNAKENEINAYYFLKLANEIYPISKFEEIDAAMDKDKVFKLSKKTQKSLDKQNGEVAKTDKISKFIKEQISKINKK